MPEGRFRRREIGLDIAAALTLLGQATGIVKDLREIDKRRQSSQRIIGDSTASATCRRVDAQLLPEAKRAAGGCHPVLWGEACRAPRPCWPR
jgi:hypothetical protein